MADRVDQRAHELPLSPAFESDYFPLIEDGSMGHSEYFRSGQLFGVYHLDYD